MLALDLYSSFAVSSFIRRCYQNFAPSGAHAGIILFVMLSLLTLATVSALLNQKPRLLDVDLGGGKSVGVVAAWPLWASSVALARVVAHCPSTVQGKRVLSLDSGLGSVGVAAAHAGAAEVLLTDADPVTLELARCSAESSGLDCSFSTMLVDWAKPSTYLPIAERDDPFDLILAGDCLHAATAPYLLSVLLKRVMISPGATCLIADPVQRTRRSQFALACRNAGLVVREGPLPMPGDAQPMRMLCVQHATGADADGLMHAGGRMWTPPISQLEASLNPLSGDRFVEPGERTCSSRLLDVDLGGGKSVGVVAAWPVWAATVALARVIAHCPSLVAGKRVLELRSGLGAVGLAAADAGAKSVMLTDEDSGILEYATCSAEHMQLQETGERHTTQQRASAATQQVVPRTERSIARTERTESRTDVRFALTPLPRALRRLSLLSLHRRARLVSSEQVQADPRARACKAARGRRRTLAHCNLPRRVGPRRVGPRCSSRGGGVPGGGSFGGGLRPDRGRRCTARGDGPLHGRRPPRFAARRPRRGLPHRRSFAAHAPSAVYASVPRGGAGCARRAAASASSQPGRTPSDAAPRRRARERRPVRARQ